MFSGPQYINCCWEKHPILFPTKEFMTVISFYLSQFVGFLILALSWVLLSILSFWCYCNFQLSRYRIVMVKHSFWYLERMALLRTPMRLWYTCTSDVVEGIGAGFRDASGNLHPTCMFTLCFMCFNCIFTYFIFYVPVIYLQMLISRQRLQ